MLIPQGHIDSQRPNGYCSGISEFLQQVDDHVCHCFAPLENPFERKDRPNYEEAVAVQVVGLIAPLIVEISNGFEHWTWIETLPRYADAERPDILLWREIETNQSA